MKVMGMEKFVTGAGKWAWGHLESPFLRFLERKAKEGTKRYPALREIRKVWMQINWDYIAQQYLHYISEIHSQFRVFGMRDEMLIKEMSTDVFFLRSTEISQV
jgi:hypothetical protein